MNYIIRILLYIVLKCYILCCLTQINEGGYLNFGLFNLETNIIYGNVLSVFIYYILNEIVIQKLANITDLV